jgi:hypothetical protein
MEYSNTNPDFFQFQMLLKGAAVSVKMKMQFRSGNKEHGDLGRGGKWRQD